MFLEGDALTGSCFPNTKKVHHFVCIHLFYNKKRQQQINVLTAIINHNSINAVHKCQICKSFKTWSDKLFSTCGVWFSAVIHEFHIVLRRDMKLCTFFGNLPELEGHSEGLSHRERDRLGLREHNRTTVTQSDRHNIYIGENNGQIQHISKVFQCQWSVIFRSV